MIDYWWKDLGSNGSTINRLGIPDGEKRENRIKEGLNFYSRIKDLKTRFQKFVEQIGEIDTGLEVPGTEKISMNEVLKRSLTKKSLKKCAVDTIKNRLILLLDTSYSMLPYINIIISIAKASFDLGEIEIRESPNGFIGKELESIDDLKLDLKDHIRDEDFVKRTRNRVIVYVGDFDGAETVYQLSLKNKVYWLCSENRLEDTIDHPWCSHRLSEFKCKIYRFENVEELVNIFKYLYKV